MTDSDSCLQARALFPKSKASEEQKERGPVAICKP